MINKRIATRRERKRRKEARERVKDGLMEKCAGERFKKEKYVCVCVCVRKRKKRRKSAKPLKTTKRKKQTRSNLTDTRCGCLEPFDKKT